MTKRRGGLVIVTMKEENSASSESADLVPDSNALSSVERTKVFPLVVSAAFGVGIALIIVQMPMWTAGSYWTHSAASVTPKSVDLGTIVNGTTKDLDLNVTNRSSYPIRVVGVQASCNCIVPTGDFPMAIEPAGSLTIPLKIRGGLDGVFSEQVSVLIDESGRLEIVKVDVAGRRKAAKVVD